MKSNRFFGRERLVARLSELWGKSVVPLATWGSELKQETYGSATAHVFAFEPE